MRNLNAAFSIVSQIKFRNAFILKLVEDEALNAASIKAFCDLAHLILSSRSGTIKSLTDIVPAMAVLTKAYPEFTVSGILIRRTMAATFMDTVLNKMLEPTKYHNQNLKIMGLINGTYIGTDVTDPATLVGITDQVYTQYAGETHMVFDLGEVPGFEYGQLRQLLIENEGVLTTAATKKAPELIEPLKKVISSLTRAKLKYPQICILYPTQSRDLRYNDLLGIVDFQVKAGGMFVPKDKFQQFFGRAREHYKNLRPTPLNGFKLSDLKGKTITMVGIPPRGWGTDRFRHELNKYDLGVTVDQNITYDTKYAFYDPATTPPEKLQELKNHNIKPVPYQSVISLLSI